MLIPDETGWCYRSTEKPFVDYFDRLKSTGMTYDEVETKLPQLQDYYFDMVIKNAVYINAPTLEGLFNDWKNWKNQ